MNMTDLAIWSQILSSIAVFITLIYLGIQTKQMNIQTQQTNNILLSDSRQATLAGDMSIINTLADHPEILLNLRSGKELTVTEATQVEALLAGLLRTREYAWNQYKEGILDEQTWESYLQTIFHVLGEKNARIIWDERLSNAINPEFAAVINKML